MSVMPKNTEKFETYKSASDAADRNVQKDFGGISALEKGITDKQQAHLENDSRNPGPLSH